MSNTSTIVNAGGSSGPQYYYNLKGANVRGRQPDVLWTLRDSWARIVLLLVEVKGTPTLKKSDRCQLHEMMVGQLLFQYRVTGLLISATTAEIWLCERQQGNANSDGDIYMFCVKEYSFLPTSDSFIALLRDIAMQSLYAHCRLLADPMHKM